MHRPFDRKVSENLRAARAMTVNDVPVDKSWWTRLPPLWIKPLLLFASLISRVVFLIWLRYRRCGLIGVWLQVAAEELRSPVAAVWSFRRAVSGVHDGQVIDVFPRFLQGSHDLRRGCGVHVVVELSDDEHELAGKLVGVGDIGILGVAFIDLEGVSPD